MKCKLCVLFLIFLIGCSKVEESSDNNDSEKNISDKQIKTEESLEQSTKSLDEKKVFDDKQETTEKDTQVHKYFSDDGRLMSAEEQLRKYYAEKGMEYPENNKIEKYTVDDPVFYTSPSDKKQVEESQDYEDLTNENKPMPQRTSSRQPPSREVIDKLNAAIEEHEETEQQPEYSDSEPPELVSIRFAPNELNAGQEAEVFVQAIDNLSGVKSIFGVINSPSESAMVSFSCALINPDGIFSGIVKIPEHAETGKWFLRSLRLTDNVFNTQNYTKTHPVLINAYITVNESDSDTAPPELISIFIDPPQAKGNDSVTIMVDAVDNKSGVYRVYGLLASPSNNAKLSFACQYSEGLNIFEGNITIPADAESGYWQVEYVRLEDTAKNAVTYYKNKSIDIFQTAKVDVLTERSDSEPPVLEDIYISPITVVYGEILKIHIKASDDISGVASVNGRIQSPSGQAFMPFYCRYNADEGEFISEIIIQNNTEVGLWQIDNIVISDNARNQSRFVRAKDPIIQQATFEVLGE